MACVDYGLLSIMVRVIMYACLFVNFFTGRMHIGGACHDHGEITLGAASILYRAPHSANNFPS
jgi:hypothetical protein